MSISSVGSGSGAALDGAYGIAVAKKQLDAQKLEGENALQLIQSSAPATPSPLKPGHVLSVVA